MVGLRWDRVCTLRLPKLLLRHSISLLALYLSQRQVPIRLGFPHGSFPFALHDCTLDVVALIFFLYIVSLSSNNIGDITDTFHTLRFQMHHQQQPLPVQIYMELQFWMPVSKSRLGWNPLLAGEPTTPLLRYCHVLS